MKSSSTAQRLKQLMVERNLKQVDILTAVQPFCKQFGVSLKKNHLSQYVSGKSLPRQDKLIVLGLALNVSEAWLMGYDVPMERNSTPSSESIFQSPTENTVHIVRRTGFQKKYTLSDVQTDVIEGMLEQLSPSSTEQIPGTIAAVTGEINKAGKKKKPTIL